MKDEVTLEQALELLIEDQPVHVFNEDGDDYFFGYKSALNEEEPVPHLVVTGIFANTEDLKDGNGEMQVITTKPDKLAIKELLKAGKAVPGASLEEKQNLSIK